MDRTDQSIERQLLCVGYAVLPIILGVASVFGLGWIDCLPQIPCMFVLVFGMYCPGCGGTRACRALLQGKLLTSFLYHPVVLYSVVVYTVFMLTNTLSVLGVLQVKPMRYRNTYLWIALILIVVNFIVKNVLLLVFDIPMQ